MKTLQTELSGYHFDLLVGEGVVETVRFIDRSELWLADLVQSDRTYVDLYCTHHRIHLPPETQRVLTKEAKERAARQDWFPPELNDFVCGYEFVSLLQHHRNQMLATNVQVRQQLLQADVGVGPTLCGHLMSGVLTSLQRRIRPITTHRLPLGMAQDKPGEMLCYHS